MVDKDRAHIPALITAGGVVVAAIIGGAVAIYNAQSKASSGAGKVVPSAASTPTPSDLSLVVGTNPAQSVPDVAPIPPTQPSFDSDGDQYARIDVLACAAATAGSDFLSAEGIMRESVGKYPKSSVAAVGLADVYLAEHKAEQAKEEIDRAISLNPNNADAYCSLSQYFRTQKDLQSALSAANTAIRLDSKGSAGYFRLGIVYHDQKKYTDSINAFKKYLEVEPDEASAIFDIALDYASLLDYSSAEEWARKAIERKPRDPSYRHLLVDILRERGLRTDAISQAVRGLKDNPANTALRLALGRLYEDDGKIEEATATYDSAVSIDPDSVDARIACGDFLAQQHQWQKAIAIFQPASEQLLNNQLLREHLGLVYLQKGDTKLAIQTLRSAVQCDPTVAEPHGNLGRALFRSGDTDSALYEYDQAISLSPDFVNYRLWYAEALVANHQEDKARVQLDQALRVEPYNTQAKKQLNALISK